MLLSTISGKGTCIVLKTSFTSKALLFKIAFLIPCKKFSSLFNEMVFFCVVVFFSFHRVVYFAVWLFLDSGLSSLVDMQLSIHQWQLYVPASVSWRWSFWLFWHILFSQALTVPRRLSFDPHPPTCLRSLLATLVVEWCTWRAQP